MKDQAIAIGGVILRTLVCAGLAWFFGKNAFGLLTHYQPEFENGGVSPVVPMATTISAGYATLFAVLALGGSFWRAMLWVDRLTILIVLYFGWQLRMLLHHEQWITGAVVLIALGVFHYVAHRHALGWIIDSHGERQKVEFWIRGEPICKSTTRAIRLKEEAQERSARRWKILGYGTVGVLLAWAARQMPQPTETWLAWVLGIFAAPLLAVLAMELGGEALYQAGYQDMKGHKVLDPEPQRPGAASIASQKVHGAASAADEDEALGLLSGGS